MKIYIYTMNLILPLLMSVCAMAQPEQIHIAYGENVSTTMTITWATNTSIGNETPVALVAEESSSPNLYKGKTNIFNTYDTYNRTMYVHRVNLTSLTPDTRYTYVVGSSGSAIYSGNHSFVTMPTDSNTPLSIAVYGDLGYVNDQSFPNLRTQFGAGRFQFAVHVGDLAYDLFSDDGRVGDNFFRVIQPIAANYPYMALPGNHEESQGFLNYWNRMTLPNTVPGKSMWYSIKVGKLRLLFLSSEVYFFDSISHLQDAQMAWLKAELVDANNHRDEQPWLVVAAHRPLLCSNGNTDDCTPDGDHRLLAEWGDLLHYSGVDLAFWAHEHNYERLLPWYDGKIMSGPTGTYIDPKAMTQIITGSAGCKEKHDSLGPVQNFTGFRSVDYGFSRLTISNATHLYLDYFSDDQNQVIDSFWLVQHYHGPRS